MAEKTLTDLSPNSTQNTTTVALNKADLNIPENATLDQIFAAIIIRGKEILTEENYNEEANQNCYITEGLLGRSLVQKNNVRCIQDSFTVNLVKPDNNTAILPSDY